MPSAEAPPRPSYSNIEWANLVELDLSLFSTPSNQQQLANQLADAIHSSGFFVVKNFRISEQDIEEQFEICKYVFALPLEEKLPYHDPERFAKGDIRGYRPIRSKLITRYVIPFPFAFVGVGGVGVDEKQGQF
jgi:isopenicillin N synthase-like dioxygenase